MEAQMYDSTFQDTSDEFIDWLSSQPDVYLSHKIKLHDYTDQNAGRGLVATEDIPEDDLLFSIPRHTLFSCQNSSLQSHLAEEDLINLGEWHLLILTMLYENSHESSKWQKYFNILPHSFSTPMFWTNQEISELQGSTLASKIGREEADQSYHDRIAPIIARHPDLFIASQCTIQDFHRMGSLIMAYSFDAPLTTTSAHSQSDSDPEDDGSEEEEEKFEKVMCPLSDLLNSDTALNNARLFYHATSLLMKSTKPIGKGDQIYNTYGDLPNSDLLRRYGYVQLPNPHDLLELPGDLITSICTLSEVDKLERVDWLLDVEVLDDSFDLDHSGIVPNELLSTVLVLGMTTPEFDTLRKSGKGPPMRGLKSEVIQPQVLKILAMRKAQYKTSIQEDEVLLQSAELPVNLRNAIHVRLSEKKILERAIDRVTAWQVTPMNHNATHTTTTVNKRAQTFDDSGTHKKHRQKNR